MKHATSRLGAAAVLSLLLVFDGLAPTPFAGAVSGPATAAKGFELEIVLHDLDAAFEDAAKEAADAALDDAVGMLAGRDVPDAVLAVHLYRDLEDYLAASAELVAGAFDRNLAFAHKESLSAHVLLQPPPSPAALEAFGLPWLTRRLIAHETVHIARYALLPNHSSHPAWFADGFAQTIATYAVDEGVPIEELPYVATKMSQVQQALEEQTLPTVEEILLGQDQDRPFYIRYAIRWAFVEFLRHGRYAKHFDDVVDIVRRTGGGPRFAERIAEPILRELPRNGRKADEDFHAWIRALRPAWEEDTRSLWPHEGGLAQLAFPEDGGAHASAWRSETLPEGDFVLSGEVTILEGPTQQMNVRLERPGGGFYQVAFTVGWGIDVFAFRPGSGWENLASQKVPSVVAGEPLPFAIEHSDGALTVTVKGERVASAGLSTPHGGGSDQEDPSAGDADRKEAVIRGRWGLSAQTGEIGSAGWWQDVKVRS